MRRTDSVVAVNAHKPVLCLGRCDSVWVPFRHGGWHHYRRECKALRRESEKCSDPRLVRVDETVPREYGKTVPAR